LSKEWNENGWLNLDYDFNSDEEEIIIAILEIKYPKQILNQNSSNYISAKQLVQEFDALSLIKEAEMIFKEIEVIAFPEINSNNYKSNRIHKNVETSYKMKKYFENK